MLVQLTADIFEEKVLSKGITVIDCWAPWCPACKDFTPIFEAAAERHGEHTFATLNTHDQEALTKQLRVTHIPTIILFRDGLLLLRQPGHLTRDQIDEVVHTAEKVDMAQIRRDMETREKEQAS